jgi:predicted dehydrogenase
MQNRLVHRREMLKTTAVAGAELARTKKLATQLGAQRHAMDNMHRVVELVKSGAIGKVTEVHSWIGGDRGMPAVPAAFERRRLI